MDENFKNIPTKDPEPTYEDFKKTQQLLLTNIGWKWYEEKFGILNHLKIYFWARKQEEDDIIKGNLNK